MGGVEDLSKMRVSLALWQVVALAILGIGLAADGARATTLTVVSGEVLVSRGEGYQMVSGQTQVAPADCLLVNPGSSAKLTYDDGAEVQVSPGSTMCVGSAAPEPSGQEGSSIITGAEGGDAIKGSRSSTALSPGTVSAGGLDTGVLVMGALTIAGSVGIILAVQNNDNPSPPASP